MTLLLERGFEKFEGKVGAHMNSVRRSIEGLDLRVLDRGSCQTFTKSPQQTPRQSQQNMEPLTQSSCELVADSSHLGANVDGWMLNTSKDTSVQSKVPMVQRSTLTPGLGSFFNMARMWCVLALVTPLFTYQPHWGLRYTPSVLFNSAEMVLGNMSVLVDRARAQVTRLARQELTREYFAIAMDVVLVVYAIGFMVISMYQATVMG